MELPKGKYIVGVSGGSDSVVLLDLLSKLPAVDLVVAHFDHGIRPESGDDRQFVEQLAARYGLPFEYAEGTLGALASEAQARQARYEFLYGARQRHAARAIVTAHHQDDAIETAIINLLRGTGRKGLTALDSRSDILRPLLQYPKAEILAYARRRRLQWREDPSNADMVYLRNYVRHTIVPRLTPDGHDRLLALIAAQRTINAELDNLLLPETATSLSRRRFVMLPHQVAREVMAAWLRANGVRDFDRAGIERLVMAVKTSRLNRRISVKQRWYIAVTADNLALQRAER